jgi:hypothetical protein
MDKKASLERSILAFILAGALSSAAGDGADLCPDEKGACCDADWTGQGATIVKIIGEGMVSQSPYVKATVGMRVRNGGRVLALEGSTVVVAFDDGCWHEVKENAVLTIEDVSPCCAVAIVPPPPPPPPPVAPNLAWVPPAAFLIGTILAEATDDDDDDDGFIPPPPISR